MPEDMEIRRRRYRYLQLKGKGPSAPVTEAPIAEAPAPVAEGVSPEDAAIMMADPMGAMQIPSGDLPKEAEALGKAMGMEKAVEPFAKLAAKWTTGDASQYIETPEAKELLGGGLQIGAMLLPYGKIAGALKTGFGKIAPEAVAKAVASIGTGAIGGYTLEAGEKIQKGEAPTPGGLTALGAAIPAAPAIIKKVLPKESIARLEHAVKHGISKAIRPSIAAVGKTAKQRDAYYRKAQSAVESIVDNKAALESMDEAGHIVKGQLPKSLDEFSDAISTTRSSIFTQYDDIAKAAGQKGATVELRPVVKELDEIIVNKVLNDNHPEVVAYAATKAKALTARGRYTTMETQEAITNYNNTLSSFYSNPSYDTASKAYIDSLVVNKMRQSLDDVIEKTTGEGYQALKTQYGALKAIEHDVNRRALVHARKNIKGIVDFSDVLSGASAVHGLLALNPATLASAATGKGIAAWIKRVNNPDKIVTNMFKNADRAITKIKATPSGQPIRTPGDIAVEGVAKGIKGAKKKLAKPPKVIRRPITGARATPTGEVTLRYKRRGLTR